MSKIKVGMIQINNSFSGHSYLPYAVGTLQGYVQSTLSDPEKFQFLEPIYARQPPIQAVSAIAGAKVAMFSTYVWNIRMSLEIAKRLKARDPEILIIMGGPQIPDRPAEFLRRHKFVDVVCHGEGEQVAHALLENYEKRNWEAVPSISYLYKGQMIQNDKVERLRDLSVVPSPYLQDLFLPLMEAHPEEHWIGLWETNRGCPFQCTFCDWGSAIAAKVNKWEIDRLNKEMNWFAAHEIQFIFCCDANFGMLKQDLEIVKYAATVKERTGYPHALSVQNTKNGTERAYQVQKTLAEAGLNKGVDIALQSIDPTTLKNIKRDNISLDTYYELQRRFTQDGVETYTDLILGMPGETYDTLLDGISTVIEKGQHNRIQFNNCAILPNAEMGDPAYREKFGMVTVESDIINIHGELIEFEGDVQEKQDLVVETASMPADEWIKARAFCWMVALLHFDKVFQIPVILVREQTGVRYREVFESFVGLDAERFPVLSEIWEFFLDKARDIQNGGPEYCHTTRWLPIWWPTDEYCLIQLFFEKKLRGFYEESKLVLQAFLDDRNLALPDGLLDQSVDMNFRMLKLPFKKDDEVVKSSWNIWEYYRGIFSGRPVDLKKKDSAYKIDKTTASWDSIDDWWREVIWWCNKKGAYLYPNKPYDEKDLSGHF
ncbi:MAG: radical SAM protein [Candidatus Lindowbacteria bacterium]|nr:radical SAM protein [Candidatus Lindowbacteria bacterium]